SPDDFMYNSDENNVLVLGGQHANYMDGYLYRKGYRVPKINSVAIPDVSFFASGIYPHIYYWATDNGLLKISNAYSALWPMVDTSLSERVVYKLFNQTYFPGTRVMQNFLFVGTDNGLYL